MNGEKDAPLDETLFGSHEAAQKPAAAPGDSTTAPQPTPSPDLEEGMLGRPTEQPQPTGWRAWLSRLLGRPQGPTPQEQQVQTWLDTIRAPAHAHRITVASQKGGIGKTTVSLAVGTVLAMYRADQCIALDGNPDAGTLAAQLQGEKVHSRSVRDLLANVDKITSSRDVRQFTHTALSRLEVLPSDMDPTKARATSEEDYALAQQVLGTYRDIIITDTGTDLTLPLYESVIDYTDTLVVAASNAVADAELAHNTLKSWYTRGTESRGQLLVPNAVVAVHLKAEGKVVDTDYLRQVFEGIARRVVFIPDDPYLTQGGRFDWDALQPGTQRAYIELTAAIAEGFQRPE